MARNQDTVTLTSGWTQLTNADATAISFQVLSGSIQIRVTATDTPPADTDQGWSYGAGQASQGELVRNLSDYANAISSGRVFARGPGTVLVDHA